MRRKSLEEIKAEVASQQWYHSIDLGDGVITPGLPFEAVWDNIRVARKHVDYSGCSVLDLGSMEGMWAFEAEDLGARKVIATDCYYTGGLGDPLEKFLICREALSSRVIPYYNVSPYQLWERLDLHIHEAAGNGAEGEPPGLFDIVQHMGLLYHQRDVLLSLSQARSVIKDGGTMLLETAVISRDDRPIMAFNGVPPDGLRLYDDVTTWWAATVPCLAELLRASLFEIVEESLNLTPDYEQGDFFICRMAVACRATPRNEVDPKLYAEMVKTYRNPGLCPERFHPW